LIDDGTGRVGRVRVERNELDGLKARGTGHFFELETALVFRSIGYFGEPIPGVPFDAKAGFIPNVEGRITRGPGGEVVPGWYAVGWIRRSPIGVIGTNKADAHGVVERMVEDVGKWPAPAERSRGLEALLEARGVRVTSFAQWRELDARELALGARMGKVREKFDSIEAMLNALLDD
jgi:ferredoxin/flavodoxin---NADP+ reductase